MTKFVPMIEPDGDSDAADPRDAPPALDGDQDRAVRQIANHLHRLNHAVMAAVETGMSIELVRSARHHGGRGNWGDLMFPVIVKR